MTARDSSAARTGGPVRRLRRWYRRFKYESADRPTSAWTVKVNWSLVVTGVLAVILTWLLQQTVLRPVESAQLDFEVITSQNRGVDDSLMVRPTKLAVRNRVYVVLGTSRGGWPISTATVRERPRIAWTVPDFTAQVGAEKQSLTPLHEPMVLAGPVLAALRTHPSPEIRAFTEGQNVQTDWFVFLIVCGCTWCLLWLVSLPVLGLIGAGEALAGSASALRRRKRRKGNRCERCGYDLTGLDFHANCPECGELLT